MFSTACILIPAVLAAGVLLFIGWHIVEPILHLAFSCLQLLLQWPILLLIVGAALWFLFWR